MGRRRFRIPKILLIGLAALGNGPCDCDDDESPTGPAGTELVTVTGVVRNIDDGSNAVGIRVTLLGTGYSDEVTTGTDGVYSLQVPKGSQLYLHTDDFNTSQSDAWFPLINIDLVPVIANSNIPDYPIHACPQTSCTNPVSATQAGSVAHWDNYLENLDQGYGNMFVPTNSAGSGGVLAFLLGDCPKSDSLEITVTSPAVEIAYGDFGGFYGTCKGQAIHPPPRGYTDASGLGFSFLDPASTAQTVTAQFADVSSAPFRMTPSPVTVPVRPGTISLIWGPTLNGAPVTFKAWACVCLNPSVFCTP